MSISQLVLRFAVGGSVVVAVSLLAQYVSSGLAGRFMTVPALTAISLYFLYSSKGPVTAGEVAQGGLAGLLPVAIYLIVAAWAFARGLPVAVVFVASLGAWMLGVIVLQYLNLSSLQATLALVILWLARSLKTSSWRSHLYYVDDDGEFVPSQAALLAVVLLVGIVPALIVWLAGGTAEQAFNGFGWSLTAFCAAIVFKKTRHSQPVR